MVGSEKKKVLFLITKSNWGGAQRYVFDLATNLPKNEFEVVVALGGTGMLIEKLKSAGIRVIQIQSLERDISLKKELFSFRDIGKIIKTERPDILHVNSSKAGGIGACMGRLNRVPRIIYTAHGWAFNEDRSFISRIVVGFFHWLTIMFAHQTISVSHALKSQMRWPFTKRKMTVVHNGRAAVSYLPRKDAYEQLISKIPQLKNFVADTWTGTIGELHPTKRHDVMIDAVEELVQAGHTIRHIIISDGELRDTLESLIADKGLENHVFLVGHLDEAAQYLKAFDVYVQPSRSEALAYTVVEAAQAGLPMVASRVGGIPEIVMHEESALLVPSGDVSALTRELTRLLNEASLRQQIASGAEKRGEYFALSRMLEETIAVYTSITSRALN